MTLEQQIELSRLSIALLERNLSEEEQRLEKLLEMKDDQERSGVAE